LPTSTKALAVDGVSRPRDANFDDVTRLYDSAIAEETETGEGPLDADLAKERT
jgi:hypothetical protein